MILVMQNAKCRMQIEPEFRNGVKTLNFLAPLVHSAFCILNYKDPPLKE